tara:strand:+ start:107 stop:328 length:222 start_codon:yes stop_codon:yes gene_type:complete
VEVEEVLQAVLLQEMVVQVAALTLMIELMKELEQQIKAMLVAKHQHPMELPGVVEPEVWEVLDPLLEVMEALG